MNPFKKGDVVRFKKNFDSFPNGYCTYTTESKYTISGIIDNTVYIESNGWFLMHLFELDKIYMRKQKIKQIKNEH